MKDIALILKRIIDFLGSLFGIIILAPFFVVISILIKMDSPGAIFFKQDRLGLNGETFKIIKFRTMVSNAEKIGDGLKIKSNNDNRITKLGKILRNTSLDELPQLFNVFKGDMSLVGPRPPVVYHPYEGYDNYPEWAKVRFYMRPGITGLSQVTVRNSVEWNTRIEYDVKYVNLFNLLLDLKILSKTFIKILFPSNIYLGEE